MSDSLSTFLCKEVPVALAVIAGCSYLQQFMNRHIKQEYIPIYSLLGDVGGTNVPLQLVLIQPPNDRPNAVVKKGVFSVADEPNFQNIIRKFLADIRPSEYPQVAMIAIAGPVDDNTALMSNVSKWGKLRGEELGENLEISHFLLLNDFIANSYGLLNLEQDNFVLINGKQALKQHPRGVLGPGTGLGNSLIFTAPFRHRQRVYVLSSQGGHSDFRYIDSQSAEYFNFLIERTGQHYICHERSFCGPEIPYMYQFYASKFPQHQYADQLPTSEMIVKQYIEDPESNTLSTKACEMFLKLYANAICDFIVTHMCTGGIYLVGSLTNAFLPKLSKMDITADFKTRHPHLSETLDKTPIIVSKQVDLGLKGAYVYARRLIADQQHQ